MLRTYQSRLYGFCFKENRGGYVEYTDKPMTNAEAKEALISRTPVTYNGINYSYISAIIYRYDRNNNLLISAELTDKTLRSVTIAQIKDVSTTYDKQNQATTFVS